MFNPTHSYDSVGHYLNLTSNEYAYATHVQITAANHVFNITNNVIYAGASSPSTHPVPNSCNVLYNPVAQHYNTLHYRGKLNTYSTYTYIQQYYKY